MKAYENLIPEGVTPTYFLYLDIDPQAIDVNIHPTKTEIKFEDDSVVFQIVYACIKEALGRNSFGDSIDFDREGLPELPALSRNFEEFRPVSTLPTNTDPSFNPFDNDGYPSEQSPYSNSVGKAAPFADPLLDFAPMENSWEQPEKAFNAGASYTSHTVERRDDYGKLFEDKIAPGKSVLVIQGKYVLTT